MNAVIKMRTIAIILAIITITIGVCLLFTYSTKLLLVGITVLMLSWYVAGRDAYIVFRSQNRVKLILDKTLFTLGLSYAKDKDTISIHKTGTKIIIKKAGLLSYVSFQFAATESKSEQYIADIVLKQQR